MGHERDYDLSHLKDGLKSDIVEAITEAFNEGTDEGIDRGTKVLKERIKNKKVSTTENLDFDTNGSLTSNQQKQIEQAGKKAGKQAAEILKNSAKEEVNKNIKKDPLEIDESLFTIKSGDKRRRKPSTKAVEQLQNAHRQATENDTLKSNSKFVQRYVAAKETGDFNLLKPQDQSDMTALYDELVSKNENLLNLTERVREEYKKIQNLVEEISTSTPPVQANQNPVLLGDKSGVLLGDEVQDVEELTEAQKLNNKTLEERISLLKEMKKAASEWNRIDVAYAETPGGWLDSPKADKMEELEKKFNKYKVKVKYADGSEGVFDKAWGTDDYNWASANEQFREQIDLRKKIVDVTYEEVRAQEALNHQIKNVSTSNQTEVLSGHQTEVLSGTDTNVTHDIIEEQKALGELELAFRGVEGSVQGFMSTSGRLATFFTNSPYLARQYADALGGVYQAQVALGNSLEIQGQGRDWNSIEYLGDGSDEASVKITKLRQDIDSLYDELSGLNVSGTGLGGAVEYNRGDYSYLIRCFEDMGTEYDSYIDAVEQGNIIEKQADENAKQLMIQLYNLEKAYKAISDAKDNVYGTHTTDEFAELAKANGYDSVIFRDIKDSFDKLSRLTDVGVIFDERQVADVKLVNDQIDNLIQKLDKIKVSGLDLPINVELPKGIEKLTDGSFANSLTGEVFADLREALESLKAEVNQTPLSSPTPDKTAESVEEKAKEIDAANEQIESSNEEVEQSEKDVAQATEEGRKKASDSVKKHADEVKKVKDEIVQANKEIAQSENNPLNTNSSSEGMKAEASAADKVADAMKEAAKAKDKFADSNKKVKASADASTPGLKAEANVVEEIADVEPMSDEWNNAIKDSKEYLSILGEVYNVTRKIRTNKDGKRLISYQLTGETGNSITIGKNRSLISSTERVDSSLDEQNYKSRLAALQQATEYEERENEYIKERNKLLAEGKKQEEDFYKATKQNNNAADAYEKLYKSAKNYYALLGKQRSGEKLTKDEDKELTRLTKEFYEATEAIGKYAKAQDELGSIESKNRYDNTKSNFANDSMQSYLDSLQESINEYNKFYNTIAANKRGLTPVVAFQENIDKLEGSIKNLQTLKEQGLDIIDANDLSMAESLRINIEKLQEQLRLMKNNKEYQVLDVIDANKRIEDIYQTLAKNTRMPKELKELFEALRQKYQLAIDTGASQKELEAINVELSELKVRLQESGKTGKSFFDLIGTKAHHLAAQFFAMYFSFQDLLRILRSGFETIKEYDKALTEMNKVSDESISTLKEFQKESFALADAVGTTASQIQNSTADFLRLGEAFEVAKQSAQEANELFKVSEFDSITEATDALIAMSQAYSELDKGEITDVLNYVGNNFSSSTEDLAVALKDAAAVLKTQGNDLYQAVALLTAGGFIIAWTYRNIC